METQLKTSESEKTQGAVALHQLIDQLAVSFLPRALQQKSFIINDVNRDLFVSADKNMLASVISCLLDTTISYTQNNCIRVSAKSFGDIALVHVKNTDTSHEMSISQSLQQVQPMAEQLGGCISITNNKLNGTTVAFTFSTQRAT